MTDIAIFTVSFVIGLIAIDKCFVWNSFKETPVRHIIGGMIVVVCGFFVLVTAWEICIGGNWFWLPVAAFCALPLAGMIIEGTDEFSITSMLESIDEAKAKKARRREESPRFYKFIDKLRVFIAFKVFLVVSAFALWRGGMDAFYQWLGILALFIAMDMFVVKWIGQFLRKAFSHGRTVCKSSSDAR